MLGFYNYTVWLTYGSLVSAVIGIFVSLAGHGHPYIGAIFLLISGLCDAFDGMIARTKTDRTEQEKQYGIQIDSLSDLVAFGVLPACIGAGLYKASMIFDPPQDPVCLSAPCDGRLSAYHLEETGVFDIKGSRYDVRALLGGDPRAALFSGGDCLVFRLCVDDYHRYHYIDDGEKGENVFIPGRLHTVRPIALEHTNVFIQNCREYTLMQTRHFGTVAQIEVGALLVGRVCNHDGAGAFTRGAEKGCFYYGGSTVVLLLQKGRATVDERFFAATRRGEETRVLLGQRLDCLP